MRQLSSGVAASLALGNAAGEALVDEALDHRPPSKGRGFRRDELTMHPAMPCSARQSCEAMYGRPESEQGTCTLASAERSLV